jgi:hypothetical protein
MSKSRPTSVGYWGRLKHSQKFMHLMSDFGRKHKDMWGTQQVARAKTGKLLTVNTYYI